MEKAWEMLDGEVLGTRPRKGLIRRCFLNIDLKEMKVVSVDTKQNRATLKIKIRSMTDKFQVHQGAMRVELSEKKD